MKGYIILEITVNDPKEYEEYKKMTPGSIAAYEGRFIVRGGQAETLEGEWNPNRIVVLEFPSVDQAKAWWESDQYSTAKALRQRIATTNMILVEGADE